MNCGPLLVFSRSLNRVLIDPKKRFPTHGHGDKNKREGRAPLRQTRSLTSWLSWSARSAVTMHARALQDEAACPLQPSKALFCNHAYFSQQQSFQCFGSAHKLISLTIYTCWLHTGDPNNLPKNLLHVSTSTYPFVLLHVPFPFFSLPNSCHWQDLPC